MIPRRGKKAWKSSEEMAGAIPAKRPLDLQKLVSATRKSGATHGFFFRVVPRLESEGEV
jgi:hypothetical protein